jgi:hypothetical protein
VRVKGEDINTERVGRTKPRIGGEAGLSDGRLDVMVAPNTVVRSGNTHEGGSDGADRLDRSVSPLKKGGGAGRAEATGGGRGKDMKKICGETAMKVRGKP